jgi:hypothetical protein
MQSISVNDCYFPRLNLYFAGVFKGTFCIQDPLQIFPRCQFDDGLNFMVTNMKKNVYSFYNSNEYNNVVIKKEKNCKCYFARY